MTGVVPNTNVPPKLSQSRCDCVSARYVPPCAPYETQAPSFAKDEPVAVFNPSQPPVGRPLRSASCRRRLSEHLRSAQERHRTGRRRGKVDVQAGQKQKSVANPGRRVALAPMPASLYAASVARRVPPADRRPRNCGADTRSLTRDADPFRTPKSRPSRSAPTQAHNAARGTDAVLCAAERCPLGTSRRARWPPIVFGTRVPEPRRMEVNAVESVKTIVE